jgi:hypothetical protein
MAPKTNAAGSIAGARRKTVSGEGPGVSSNCGAALRAMSTGTSANKSIVEPIANGANPRVPNQERIAGPTPKPPEMQAP